MTREEAREYFAKHGLSYKDINPSRLRMLFSILNEAFSKEEQTAIKEGVTPYWVRANDDKTFKAKFGDDGLICAYITGKGGYFNAREAISFNPDGRVNGMSGANLFGGTYEIGKDGSIKFSQMLSTRRMGKFAAYETKFLTALSQVDKVSVSGGELILSKGGEALIKFKQIENPKK